MAAANKPGVRYRDATPADVPGMARLRAASWGSEEYWRRRVAAYLAGESRPQHALPSRAVYVGEESGELVGLVAGHLTRRFDCAGELQWIDVAAEHRRRGIGSELLLRLGAWFGGQEATRVCVDVAPENAAARAFYRRHGAEDLRPHWMVWRDVRDAVPRDRQRRTLGPNPSCGGGQP